MHYAYLARFEGGGKGGKSGAIEGDVPGEWSNVAEAELLPYVLSEQFMVAA